MDFEVLNDRSQFFFKILPPDWREAIEPIWQDYREEADIYVFREGEEVVAGGIVFKATPPNRTDFEIEKGENYIRNGFHYIGFLFVAPDRRNEALGTRWLRALKNRFPEQSYWLTIEEEGLKQFYTKNGFECVASSTDRDLPEWLFVYFPFA
ncbi:MAG TPA: GNAT family N-acetyltransferase [Arenibacter sp.]|nr:GNAT family N-acetyltransferase [Arenibacter sp.]